MAAYLYPALFALLVWWASTGLVLFLDGLPRTSFPRSLAGTTLVAAAAVVGVLATRDDASVRGAYVAFGCGLLVWGWHEMSFLTGYVTGPRKIGCPRGCRGWPHFVHATEAVLYHELAVLATAAALVALTWTAANPVAATTFLLLWLMRLSAKLNLFLGVRNPGIEFLPPHLRYLESFFRRRPINRLFPASLAATAGLLVWLTGSAAAAPAGGFEATGFSLLAALVALGVLEHCFLVWPWPVTRLWSWGFRSRGPAPAQGTEAAAVAKRFAP
jgi:putative photosynthetic complex assembly protein 2